MEQVENWLKAYAVDYVEKHNGSDDSKATAWNIIVAARAMRDAVTPRWRAPNDRLHG
jgi:hypothetical protein